MSKTHVSPERQNIWEYLNLFGFQNTHRIDLPIIAGWINRVWLNLPNRPHFFHDLHAVVDQRSSKCKWHLTSTSWELRNSALPMIFQSENVKEISTSISTIQICFCLLTGLQFKHVNCTSSFVRELRNSVLLMLFQFGNVKDVHLISTSTSTIQVFSTDWLSFQTRQFTSVVTQKLQSF